MVKSPEARIAIEQFHEANNYQYSYRDTKYRRMYHNIKVRCLKHGEFTVNAREHSKGIGCKICNGDYLEKTELYVAKLIGMFGTKYDYSQVVFVDYNTRVTIVCPIHGAIKKTPKTLSNRPTLCNECAGKITPKERDTLTTATFISKSKDLYGDSYDYSLVDYKGIKAKVEIVCHLHGSFLQNPDQHLNRGYGCKLCSAELTKKAYLANLDIEVTDLFMFSINNRVKAYTLNLVGRFYDAEKALRVIMLHQSMSMDGYKNDYLALIGLHTVLESKGCLNQMVTHADIRGLIS